MIKITIYLRLRLHEGRPTYIRILQPLKDYIEHFKTTNFSSYFFFCGPLFPPVRYPDPDAGDQNVCGSIRIRISIHITGANQSL
jgi:hypothetical protein